MAGSADQLSRRFRLSVLPDVLAIARLHPAAPIPSWVGGEFFSVTRTTDELSIVFRAATVPEGVKAERGWRALKVHGPFALSQVGVLAALSSALAAAGVSVFAIATFDTDYLLVSGDQLRTATEALRRDGHNVETGD
jgi:uncharacterized protein